MKSRSQRAFVGVTLTTVLGVAFVLIVYAALLGTIVGPGEVTVGGTGGNIYYSIDNVVPGSWETSKGGSTQPIPTGNPWYARWETSAGYVGRITVAWQLQNKVAGTWADVFGKTASTTCTLNGTLGELVYATVWGGYDLATNHNWGGDVTTQGTYRVTASVSSA